MILAGAAEQAGLLGSRAARQHGSTAARQHGSTAARRCLTAERRLGKQKKIIRSKFSPPSSLPFASLPLVASSSSSSNFSSIQLYLSHTAL
jgi:hypothetical protein